MKKQTTIKDYLSKKVPDEILALVNRSFEIIGDIAIIEISENVLKYEQLIGEAILKVNTHIKVILKKSGIHKGEFRTQDLIYITGEKRYETIYKENGINLLINPEKVYFSAKLSTEREKLMLNLKKKSNILIMFSGSGPYSFVALKKQPNLGRITSIEINPEGHHYAKESLKLNKNLLKKSDQFKLIKKFLKENNLPIFEKLIIKNLNLLKIEFINCDVKNLDLSKIIPININMIIDEGLNLNLNPKEIYNTLKQSENKKIFIDLDKFEKVKFLKYYILFCDKFEFLCKISSKIYLFNTIKLKGLLLLFLEGREFNNLNKYDEIFMPLPKDAILFLDTAFNLISKNGIIHLYDFILEKDFPKASENKIKKIAKKQNIKIKIITTRKVGQYAPGKFRICCDFKIL